MIQLAARARALFSRLARRDSLRAAFPFDSKHYILPCEVRNGKYSNSTSGVQRNPSRIFHIFVFPLAYPPVIGKAPVSCMNH